MGPWRGRGGGLPCCIDPEVAVDSHAWCHCFHAHCPLCPAPDTIICLPTSIDLTAYPSLLDPALRQRLSVTAVNGKAREAQPAASTNSLTGRRRLDDMRFRLLSAVFVGPDPACIEQSAVVRHSTTTDSCDDPPSYVLCTSSDVDAPMTTAAPLRMHDGAQVKDLEVEAVAAFPLLSSGFQGRDGKPVSVSVTLTFASDAYLVCRGSACVCNVQCALGGFFCVC